MAKPTSPSTLRGQKTNERRQDAASNSTKQIAKNAVHGGPKSDKKDKRPTSGGRRG